jgi:serine/threonine protein kinase
MHASLLGQLKLVDFGTCKDLVDLSLNGQEFVGTAEYMAPEIIRSKFAGPAADLWSLGIIAFQLLYGYTPFYSPSPYMIFLKVKRAMLRLPFETEAASDDGHASTSSSPSSSSSSSSAVAESIEYSLLHKLLVADPAERFKNCSGMGMIAAADFTPAFNFASISYDQLRSHPFFSADPEWVEEEKALHPTHTDGNDGSISGVSPQFLRSVHTRPARRVGRLSELALRSVCDAALKLSDVMATNGGVRPDIEWVKVR